MARRRRDLRVGAGRWYWRLALTLILTTLASGRALAAQDVLDMDLAELLDVELEGMEVTGIHHTHDAGDWMVGYRFMYMGMEGNLDGTTRQSAAQVFAQGFMVVPTGMSMEMHMLHVMYGATDRVTLMLMLPYRRNSMDHIRRDGVRFTTRSSGLGDLELRGLLSVFRDRHSRIIAVAAVSAPTGSIDATDQLPGMMGMPSAWARLPYPMQLGSGTWDFKPALTYIGQVPKWQWGAHAGGTIRTGRNSNQYRLGNAYDVGAWGARRLTDWSSFSLRLRFNEWFDIHGADPQLSPLMVPTADPDRRAGRRLDLLAGINLFSAGGRLAGLRLILDGGLPVYQSLNGPQLETDWMIGVGLERTF